MLRIYECQQLICKKIKNINKPNPNGHLTQLLTPEFCMCFPGSHYYYDDEYCLVEHVFRQRETAVRGDARGGGGLIFYRVVSPAERYGRHFSEKKLNSTSECGGDAGGQRDRVNRDDQPPPPKKNLHQTPSKTEGS